VKEFDTMLDQRYCNTVGDPETHARVVELAKSAGYARLRDAVAHALDIPTSRCARIRFTVEQAERVIEALEKEQQT